MTNFPDWAYKTFWTAVAAALGNVLAGPALFGVEVWRAAGMSATVTVLTALLAFARERSA